MYVKVTIITKSTWPIHGGKWRKKRVLLYKLIKKFDLNWVKQVDIKSVIPPNPNFISPSVARTVLSMKNKLDRLCSHDA